MTIHTEQMQQARSASIPPRRDYITLNLMRGSAAILVALDHFNRHIGITAIDRGYVAVDFFFVLSGFVLSAAYAERIGHGLGRTDFLRRRLIRLYPMFAIGMILGMVELAGAATLGVAQGRQLAGLAESIVPNFLLLPVVMPAAKLFPMNGPMWTLSLEVVMNLFFAILLRRMSTRALVGVAVAAGMCVAWLAWRQGTLNIGWSWQTMPGGSARAMFGFTAGMVIARIVRDRSGRVTGWAVAVCAMLAVVMVAGMGEPARLAADLASGLVLAPALVMAGAVIELPPAWRRIAGAAGAVSFPLYCIHFPLIVGVAMACSRLHLPPVSAVAVFATVSIAAAWASLLWIDRPIRQWLAMRASRSMRSTGQPLAVRTL